MKTNNYTYYFGESIKCTSCLKANILVETTGCECGGCLVEFICYECKTNYEKENLGKEFYFEF